MLNVVCISQLECMRNTRQTSPVDAHSFSFETPKVRLAGKLFFLRYRHLLL